MKPIRCLLLILLSLCFFSGCLEFSEFTQIQSDGSVNYELRITIPDFPEKDKKKDPDKDVEKDIAEFMKETHVKGLTPVGNEDKKVDGLKIMAIKLKGNSLLDLNGLYASIGKGPKEKGDKKKGKEAFDQLFAKSGYQVKKTKSGTLKISRAFTPPKMPKAKKSDEGEKKMNKEFEEMFMNMFRFKFEVFVPTELVQSNAEMVFGNNLRWESTFGYLTKNPMTMEFEIRSNPELDKALAR